MSSTVLVPGNYVVPEPPPPIPPLPPIVLPQKCVLVALHLTQLQQLWYEARDASAPKTGPHGTCAVTYNTDGSASFAFHPITLPSGHSDNVYNLGRFGACVPSEILLNATQFSNNVWVKIDNPQNVQQFELDLPCPLNNGTMGLAFTPGKPFWTVRVFDFVRKTWVATGVSIDPSMFLTGVTIGGEYTIVNGVQTLVNIVINGVRTPVNFSQEIGVSLSPRFNAAIQFDGKNPALPYTITVNNFFVTLQ